MFTMGTDFEYQNANSWFKNLDKLIHYVNLDGRVNVFYSTPTLYTNSKHEAMTTWTTKQDDFFPYGFFLHGYLTGFFTSRPALKGYVRSCSTYLQVCRQLEVQMASKLGNASSWGLWEVRAKIRYEWSRIVLVHVRDVMYGIWPQCLSHI